MRTDQNVHLTQLDLFQNQLLFFRCAEARDHFDRNGEEFEALFECLEVLEAEDGCRS